MKNKIFQHQYQKQVKMYLFVCISWLVSFGVCIYIRYYFDVVRNKLQTTNIYTRVDKKKIKSSRKEYVIRICFKLWPMKNIIWKLWANESLNMACLQITKNYCHLWLFSEFIQTQKRYPTSIDKIGILT